MHATRCVLAIARRRTARLLRQHEHRGFAETMGADHRRVGRDAGCARRSRVGVVGMIMLGRGSSCAGRSRGLTPRIRQSPANPALGQFAADEDDTAFALFIVLPGALLVAVEDHVHALEDETLRIVLEGEDALASAGCSAFLLGTSSGSRERTFPDRVACSIDSDTDCMSSS